MASLYSKDDEKRPCDIPPRRDNDPRSNYRRDYARLIHSPSFRRLQGKTQLFPGIESDFFRNRLTHSLEVAQIAKGIAIKLNGEYSFLKRSPIDYDLVEIAALAHDLGHPPFGHNGEEALDNCMKGYGGFEGNAQTLRILASLEKRELSEGIEGHHAFIGVDHKGREFRNGLNLTFRTLAAVLKYDREIPLQRTKNSKIVKGYYYSEASLVRKVKRHVLNGKRVRGKFKTIECSIMDIADDIAYSTYDLEDAFKGGFIEPLSFLKVATIEEYSDLVDQVSKKVSKSIGRSFSPNEVRSTLFNICKRIIGFREDELDFDSIQHKGYYIAACSKVSNEMAKNGYFRTHFTSDLVNEFIQAVKIDIIKGAPLQLYGVSIEPKVLEKVEVLKQFTYNVIIMSPMLKVVQYRGGEIVKEIFQALAKDNGYQLLPDDFKRVFEMVSRKRTKKEGMRVICDFIAGMTDRYAVEFYGRLVSENAQTIFKPL